MSQAEKLVGATGLIRVAGLEITIVPLTTAEELALDRELRKGAAAASADVYTRCRPELDALKEYPADRVEFLRELARIAARREGPSPTAIFEHQTSAAGVALELFSRGRKATPGLTLAAIEAVVTPVNAAEVFCAIQELLKGPDEKH